MLFSVCRGHKITYTHWSYRGEIVSLQNTNAVASLLRKIRDAEPWKFDAVRLSPKGGVIEAQFGCAFGGKYGDSRFIQYQFFNPNGTIWLYLSGILGIPRSPGVAGGVILLSTEAQETTSVCTYQRHVASLVINFRSGQLSCGWFEPMKDDEPDTGRVLEETREVFAIRGQTRNQEAGAAVLKHQVLSGPNTVARIYPHGSWALGGWNLIKRWIRSTIPVVEYFPALYRELERTGAGGVDAFTGALCASLICHRPVEPNFS